MSAATVAPPALRLALYEGVGAEPLDGARRGALLATLLKRGHQIACTGVGGEPVACAGRDLLVFGRFAGRQPVDATDPSGVAVRFRDLDALDSDGVLAAVAEIEIEVKSGKPGAWKPWFPVIDYDRCTNCMQCLSFCLFDVYGVDKAGKISVGEPTNCKTNCPACSRVCPEVAIMFPKYKSGPINGEQVSTDDVRREHMKIDISALLGGDIYSMLRDRSQRAKSRFGKERDADRALAERTKCLTKLQQALDIPPELLANLPGAEAIAAKATAAAQAAGVALSRPESPRA